MANRITFLKKINDSVQVGDELYRGAVTGGVVGAWPYVGAITGVGEKYVEVANSGSAVASDFFMFRKPSHNGHTNISSLKGYYAEVEFTNNSTSKQELFTVGSEVTESSK